MDTTPTEVPTAAQVGASAGPRPMLRLARRGAPPSWPAVGRTAEAAPWSVAAAAFGVAVGIDVWQRIAGALAGMLLAAAAVADVRERRLPNRLVGAAFAVALGGAAAAGGAAVMAAATGAVLAGGLVLTVHLSRGVGMGDVKAAAAIGTALGPVAWWAPPSAIAVAAVVASCFGAVRRVQHLPFGPSLMAGWAAVSIAARWW